MSLTSFVIAQRFALEIFEYFRTEMFLQSVGVESKQTFDTISREHHGEDVEKKISRLPMTSLGIIDGIVFEFVVHTTIEIFTEKEWPKSIERIHFHRLAGTKFHTF